MPSVAAGAQQGELAAVSAKARTATIATTPGISAVLHPLLAAFRAERPDARIEVGRLDAAGRIERPGHAPGTVDRALTGTDPRPVGGPARRARDGASDAAQTLARIAAGRAPG